MNSRTQGFSLPELMIVVALTAAVLAIGAPNFQQFRLNNRLTNAANDMLGVVTVARTEAIKRQRDVSACRSDNPNAADPKCSATAEAGWIVFLDANKDCLRDDSMSEPLLTARAFDIANTGNPLRVRTDGDCLSFAPNGFRQEKVGTPINHIALCDSRGMTASTGPTVSAGRGVLITVTGRARITRQIGGDTPDDVSSAAWVGVKCPS